MACRCGRWRPGKAVGALLVLWLALALCGCASTKKNTAATRNYNAFITRYNIYYNGDTHYRETLQKMEESYEDDYSRLVLMHPVEAKGREQTPQPTGNFDRSIEKGQKAIQLRSIKKRPRRKPGKSGDPAYQAWLKRDEYNPFLHNAWMMMGRSQFFNGDFLGAASTFFYISRHFSWLPQTVTEAKLWQARSYVAMDWLYDAELILERLKPDQLTTPALRGLYAYVKADCLVRGGHYEEAVEPLREAIKAASGAQRTRLRFLLGQVLERRGRRKEAYEAFGKAGASSSATYRTKFNARIKQSEVFSGEDISGEVKALRRMTRYDRNKQYLDQIYYAIGNLYLSRRDTAQAIENYELAVEKSTRSGIDKALAQLTLGGLYYDRHLYAKAQPCYSEAVPVIPDTYPGYAVIKRRSDILDELAVYSQNVELQDSLLRLSAMTPEEQMKVVEKIIEELKKKEKEEAEAAAREEFLAQRGQEGLQDQNNQVFTMNTGDDSWYFYNTATKNAGRTEFQRRWGNRKLEDDWRRRNKQTFSFNDFGSDQAAAEGEEVSQDEAPADSVAAPDAEALKKENDPHYPEYYLKQIPKTDMEKQTANDIIQEGLYNMGVILKDKMEDFAASEEEFETLLRRYPDNVYRLDTYYNLYLMFMRAGNLAKAEKYRQLILSDFPDTKYGLALKDPDYIGSLRRMQEMEGKLYDQTLDAYLEDDNRRVHALYDTFSKQYPLSKLMPKFMFLEALSYVTENKPDQFRQTLMEMLERYPDTDMTEYASAYLKGLAQGKKLQSGMSNMRGMLWDTRLGNDSIPADTTDLKFDLDPSQRQLLILLYPTETINSNALLFEVARHNFSSFVVKDFDLELMNFGRLGLLIIKGFGNVKEINHYLKVLDASTQFRLPDDVRPVVISEKNFDTLLRSGRSFEDYFRYMQDKTYEDTQERVLPSEFFEHQPPGLAPEGYEGEDAPADLAPAEPVEEPREDPREESGEEPQATPGSLTAPASGPIPGGGTQPASTTPSAPGKSPVPPPPAKSAPAAPAVPPPPARPSLPDYPEGSEGDDPLFD